MSACPPRLDDYNDLLTHKTDRHVQGSRQVQVQAKVQLIEA